MAVSQSIVTHPPLPAIPGVTLRLSAQFHGYAIGDDGSVWSCRKGVRGNPNKLGFNWIKMRPVVIGGRYLAVTLKTDSDVRRLKYVHTLVLEAFIGPRPDGMHGCHSPDPNPSNCRLSNLRWDTPSANNRDKEQHGTHQVGQRNPRAKLTDANVLDIRERCAAGGSCKSVAKDFGVSSVLVSMIKRRKIWTHI